MKLESKQYICKAILTVLHKSKLCLNVSVDQINTFDHATCNEVFLALVEGMDKEDE
jgi:hypothetical protein